MAIELPELVIADATAWSGWLASQHADSTGVFLVLAKKGVIEPTSLTYDQALDEALCWGWIDGQVGRRDAVTFRQRFTPRRPRSAWSARNVGLIARLTAEGRMQPSGVAQVEQARSDGRWDTAYAGQASIELPPALAEALTAEPWLADRFAKLTSQNRYALIRRVSLPRQEATRVRQLAAMLEMLRRGETIHPQRGSLE